MAVPRPEQATIVGGQRCGSTSLLRALRAHPDVMVAEPQRPEPKWFLEPGSGDRVVQYITRYFPGWSGDTLRVEKSTSYLESDVAPVELDRAFPTSPVVVVLRDPVERALSHYRLSVRGGAEDLTLLEALDPAQEGREWDRDEISVSPYRYLSRGRYVDDLARWDRVLGPDRVVVVILEELRADPAVFAELQTTLGLAPEVLFPVDERHNAGEGDDLTLDDETRGRLAAWFAEPNAALAQRLGRPLSHWTAP